MNKKGNIHWKKNERNYDILDRMESVFGNVAAGESVTQEFYTAIQKQDEIVTAWGLRLEEILQKAVRKGHVKQEEIDSILEMSKK